MTREQILKDPGFLRLTDKQKMFVTAMMDCDGDKVEAASTAYKCKDRFSAVSMASKMMRNLTVSRLLNAYFGEKPSDRVPTRDELAGAAWERAVNSDDENSSHKWFTLVARVLKYDRPDEEPEPPKKADKSGEGLVAELESRGLLDAKQPSSK